MAAHQGPRTAQQRKADVLEKLREDNADLWVASASASGSAHLVPLSLAWDGERVIVATDPNSITARNIVRSREARLALGGTRDVVMIDVVLDEVVDVEQASAELADGYARQADWDPRHTEAACWYLALRPQRVQAWREADEIGGRTLMRDGEWVV